MIIKAARQIKNASRYSLQGLKFLLRSEMAARLEIYGFVWVMALFVLLKEPKFTFMMFSILFSITLAIEALNTAVEVIIDEISPDYSETARNAKDLGSFAVMCLMMITCLYVGGVLYSANWNHFSTFIMSSFGKGSISIFLMGLSLHFLMKSKHAVQQKWFVLLLYGLTLFGMIIFFVANYFTGVGIDERVAFHLKTGLQGAGFSEYYTLIFMTVLAIFSSVVFLVLCHDFFGTKIKSITKNCSKVFDWELHQNLTRIDLVSWLKSYHVLAAISMILLLLICPFYQNVFSLLKDKVKEHSFNGSSVFYEIPKLQFLPDKKNIVYIYLEGVERTYMDQDRFPDLTPNLSVLEKRATSFTDIRDTFGARWTIAGLVTSQCGVPLYLGGDGNSAGKIDQFMPEALCLGDILQGNAYQTKFISGGKLKFAGKEQFLKKHGFKNAVGKKYFQDRISKPNTFSGWGVFDNELYAELVKTAEQFYSEKKPFGLFGLTLDTHGPNGHLTPSCEGVKYQDGKNHMLNAVKCADKLVVEFVKKIQAMDQDDNTIIILTSDHLAMNNAVLNQLSAGPRKNLFMVIDNDYTNDGLIDKPGSILDITPTILPWLGINDRKFGFGRDLRADAPTLIETYPNKEYDQVLKASETAIGSWLWGHPSLTEEMIFDGTNKTLTINDRALLLPAIIQFDRKGKTHAVSHLSVKTLKLSMFLPKKDNFLWVDYCETLAREGFEIMTNIDSMAPVKSWCWAASNSKENSKKAAPLLDQAILSKEMIFSVIQP